MTSSTPGPLDVIASADGAAIPIYVLRFATDGTCESPLTRAQILERLARGEHTDVYLFAHGWNNDWETATARYRSFIEGYVGLRRQHGLAIGRDYRPILVGIAWPSTSLLFSWEEPPEIAGTVPLDDEDAAIVGELAGLGAAGARLRALAARPKVSAAELRELAELLAPALAADDEEEGAPASPEELLAAWRGVFPSEAPPAGLEFGAAGAAAGPSAAGLLDALDPRKLLRLFTVRTMKDRAGHVGAHGVGPLLHDVLAGSQARVHTIGHSYGARVMLSALCGVEHPRRVSSMLLLQAAVNHLCFTGGYEPALERVVQPIFATFSRRDFPLRRVFHLALRRSIDLAEAQIAGAPPRFGALGGYGPGGVDAVTAIVPMKLHPERYVRAPGVRVIALEAHEAIHGHGDVSNAATWWALYDQVAAEEG